MKLIGSRTESIIHDSLIKSEHSILNNNIINHFLKARFNKIISAYCLEHTIGEDYDLYTLLVNREYVVEFELSRIDNKFKDINIDSLSVYSKRIKDKHSRLKLLVAINLSK
ncbi:hypothetical protein [Proteus hauseri]|uniref:hypothetical protein n=1 Tax=Proteus hauseri TaxID=183417 RepID=UPI0032DAD38C